MSRLPFVALGGALFLYMCEPAEAIVSTKRCTLQAPGDACIFDLHTNAAGTLRVCTKALAASERWRSTVGKTNTAGGSSAVGSGTTACTGAAAMSVVANADYEATVTLDRPKSGGFPRQVDVTIDVPAAAIPVHRSNAPGGGPPEACGADGEVIECGDTISCRFDDASDTDLFRFDAALNARAVVRICGPFNSGFTIYKPDGTPLPGGAFPTSALAAGRYKIVTRNGNGIVGDYFLKLQGVSPPLRCVIRAISAGSTVAGNLDSPCDIDTYSYLGAAGQKIQITLSGPFNTNCLLYDQNGNSVVGGCGAPTLPSGGSYTIVILNGNGISGNYSLTLQLLSS